MIDQTVRRDVAEWVAGEPVVAVGPGEREAHLLNALLLNFWKAHPDHETADGKFREVQLNEIAGACGLAHYARLPGKAICESNGGRTLYLRPGM